MITRLLLVFMLAVAACDPGASAQEAAAPPLPETNYYAITTPAGRMVVRLFDDTPIHRDNFKKLVEEQFYDSTRFHRVMAGFMIQGGDPLSKNADPGDDGTGGPGYDLDAEIGKHYHVRGALAAAREGDNVNPQRRSSGSQFYIVQGVPLDTTMLAQMRVYVRQAGGNAAFDWPADVRARYLSEGGYPPLDEQYTVFGELVEGFEVLDAIANMETARMVGGPPGPMMDQPPVPVPMTVTPLENYSPPARTDTTRAQ